MVYILRNEYKQDIKYIHFYKKYEPLTSNSFYHEKQEVNDEYVSNIWSYDDFLKHDIHIIKSTTGTGKTTATSQHMEQLMGYNKDIKFISITTRTSLSDQHKESFRNINLTSYQETGTLDNKRAITICLNSLERLAF